MLVLSIGKQQKQRSPGMRCPTHLKRWTTPLWCLSTTGDWTISYSHSATGKAAREASLLPDHLAGHTKMVWDTSHLAVLSGTRKP